MNNTVIAIGATDKNEQYIDIGFRISLPDDAYTTDYYNTVNGTIVLNTGDYNFLNSALVKNKKIIISGSILNCSYCKFQKEYIVSDTNEIILNLKLMYDFIAVSNLRTLKRTDNEYLFIHNMDIHTIDSLTIYDISYDPVVLSHGITEVKNVNITTISKTYGSGLIVKFNVAGIYTIKVYSKNKYGDITNTDIVKINIGINSANTNSTDNNKINYIEWE